MDKLFIYFLGFRFALRIPLSVCDVKASVAGVYSTADIRLAARFFMERKG